MKFWALVTFILFLGVSCANVSEGPTEQEETAQEPEHLEGCYNEPFAAFLEHEEFKERFVSQDATGAPQLLLMGKQGDVFHVPPQVQTGVEVVESCPRNVRCVEFLGLSEFEKVAVAMFRSEPNVNGTLLASRANCGWRVTDAEIRIR